MADPSFSLSRNQIIIDALLMVGAYATGEQPDSFEFSTSARRLNSLLNELAPFISVPKLVDKEFTITPGTQSYTVGDGKDIDMYRPYELVSARRKNASSNNEISVDVVSRQEYMELPTKSTQAPPNMVYYHPRVSDGMIYLWPTGDSTWNKMIFTFKTPLNTLDATSDTLDLPQEWHDAVTYLLAEAIAPTFLGDVPGWLERKAQQKRALMLAHDTEDGSVYIRPDLSRHR